MRQIQKCVGALVAILAATCVVAVPRPQTFYYTGAVPQPAPSVVLLQHAPIAPISPLAHVAALPPTLFVHQQRDEKPAEAGEVKPEETSEKPEGETEGEGEGEGWTSWFTGFLPNFPGTGSSTSNTQGLPQPAPGAPTRLEELEPAGAPGVAKPEQGEAKYILGQPQFFGNPEGLRKLGVQNLANKGALPSFVLVRGGAGVGPGYSHVGGKPLPLPSPLPVAGPEPEKLQAGSAALAFQREMQARRQMAQSQANAQGLNDARPDGAEDAEDVEAGAAPGPSVAQVKPQAIALAGPGGVAAAAPVGTALVGPGGLAVAAPAATAVAGPAGGAPPIVAPATSRVLAAYVHPHLQPQQLRAQRDAQALPSAVVALLP